MSTADFPLDSEGVWCQIMAQPTLGQAALFLDRDGVVTEEVEYLRRPEDIAIIPGAGATIAAANARGIPVVLVTNQAGIGRGYYSWRDFEIVQNEICAILAKEGARFDAVFACAHHPDGQGPFVHPSHPARKPNPGMLLRASAALSLDLKRSWLVGDKLIDIQAAKNAGLAGAMHVATGYGLADRAGVGALATPSFQVLCAPSIKDAVALPLFRSAQDGK